ncbi:MAG: S8 family serine peptidase [Gaiellaceae bacterium]
MTRLRLAVGVLLLMFATAATPFGSATPTAAELKSYTVVLAGDLTGDGFALAGTKEAALGLVTLAGGTITQDISSQIGVLGVTSANPLFADLLRASPLVEEAAEEFVWKAFPSYEEAVESGQLVVVGPEDVPGGGPDPQVDVLEALQWNMELIRAPQAHAHQAGARAVEVGILDTGIDGAHADFVDLDGSNVNCLKGRDFIPAGPGAGSPVPCVDNNFHGTHVAGIVAARKNVHGVIGVAPNVSLVPVKVCDAAGYCYSNSTAAGITYAGDAKLEVINMSFFVDDDQLLESTEFKCATDPQHRAFRHANERAIAYARNQGVVPVAALGNSDVDLAHPPAGNECEVVPAETQGVIGTMALGPTSEKASYSNYGFGMTDVAAPGGNSRNPNGEIPGPCGTQVLSTIPGNVWGCFQGTSMASPHTAGVSALIVSQFGRLSGGDVVIMRPQEVESYLQSTTIDLVAVDGSLRGYDGCFGNGRIDALKAVLHDTKVAREPVPAPIANGCPTFR